jgi:hypothetical protein
MKSWAKCGRPQPIWRPPYRFCAHVIRHPKLLTKGSYNKGHLADVQRPDYVRFGVSSETEPLTSPRRRAGISRSKWHQTRAVPLTKLSMNQLFGMFQSCVRLEQPRFIETSKRARQMGRNLDSVHLAIRDRPKANAAHLTGLASSLLEYVSQKCIPSLPS